MDTLKNYKPKPMMLFVILFTCSALAQFFWSFGLWTNSIFCDYWVDKNAF
ncbi:MAG: hypothetical protein IBX44_08070 [Sulfurospirillum sp.]|nr:hypothetical protein [Sulfurospirillum sp.]